MSKESSGRQSSLSKDYSYDEKSRNVNVLITVNDVKFDIDQVTESLKKAGLTHATVMPLSGLVGGTTSLAKMPQLKEIAGVDSVEFSGGERAFRDS